MNKQTKLGLLGAVVLLLVAYPLFGSALWINNLFFIFFAVALAAAWNILGGIAGQVSFGYSAFLGIGAYATMLLHQVGVNPWLTLPVGAVLAVIFSFIVGWPTFRLRGPYFSIATIGVGEAIRVLMDAMEWTGGPSGISMHGNFNAAANYYGAFVLAGAALFLNHLILRSKLGLGLAAIKGSAEAAEDLGVNVVGLNLRAHAISAAIVGVAGGLYAMQIQFINPGSVFSFQTSLSMVMMAVVGGVGTVAGPLIGGVIFGYVEKQLMASLPNLYLLIYGVLLILVMVFEPGGVVGLYRRVQRWWGQRSARKAAKGGVQA
jgi:branched-chain amino acid transport system permease protein